MLHPGSRRAGQPASLACLASCSRPWRLARGVLRGCWVHSREGAQAGQPALNAACQQVGPAGALPPPGVLPASPPFPAAWLLRVCVGGAPLPGGDGPPARRGFCASGCARCCVVLHAELVCAPKGAPLRAVHFVRVASPLCVCVRPWWRACAGIRCLAHKGLYRLVADRSPAHAC